MRLSGSTSELAFPDSPVLADRAGRWRSAYVHAPFCARVCPYCDFAVVAGKDELIDRYMAAVSVEIEMEPPWEPLDAVYVGGGTPSRIPPRLLDGVIAGLANRFSLAADSEVSLEANPEDWSPELAASLRAAGFNRVSFGAQSFDPRVLSALGRNHKPLDIVDAVAIARRAGFDSVNLDLIFGTPSETLSDWQRTLEEALDLVPDHLSLYALTVERGTALSRAVMAGAAAPDADLQADQYELACRMAGEAGLHRYEVSNWARPGHECRYNLSVWGQGEYLAFGNGAHGHRDGVRRHNPARVQAYMEKIESGHRSDAGNQTISGWAAEQERLLLGLRRSAGVICGRSGAALLASEWGRRLAAAGILARQEDRLVITRPLLTDEVSRAVLALSPVEC